MAESEVWYTATQPQFFPYLFMLERFARCHHVVLMREAQWNRKHGHTFADLGSARLTLTVKERGQRPLDELEILPGWSGPMMNKLQAVYGRCSGWPEKRDQLQSFLDLWDGPGLTVADVGQQTAEWALRQLGMTPAVHESKDLVPRRPANPTRWIAGFGRALVATDYLQGARAIAAYFEPGAFAPIRVWGQDYRSPDGIRADLSFLDAWFRFDVEEVQRLVRTIDGPGTAAGTVVRMASFD